MPTIKPCPCCNGTDIKTEIYVSKRVMENDKLNAKIRCADCGLSLETNTGFRDWTFDEVISTVEQAILKWNRRALNGT